MNHKKIAHILVFCFAFSAVLSCAKQTKQVTQWIKPDSVTISCEDYYSEVTDIGVLTNNVWNKHAAQSNNWKQCLETKVVNGVIQYGWSWQWPSDKRVIYSQPQIKIGASPWAPTPKFNDAFPLKINTLKQLDISHELEITSIGEHNTATTMWLTSERYVGDQANEKVIAAEIMIWTHSTNNHFDPAGKKLDELKIDNKTWEVWYQKDWEDQSGINENNWISLSFKAKQSGMKANIPALALLQYALENKLISDPFYIADIELGNEIMSGSGLTWVKEFEVLFE